MRRAHVHAVVEHEQVAALDELDAHLLGQERVLEVGRVVDAGRQHHDGRPAARAGDAAARREPDEVVEHAARVEVDRAHAERSEPVGERARHDLPVREHVGDAARRAQVVLEHHPAAVVAADQVAADDVQVLVVGHVDADDLAAEVAREHDQPARHDAVVQDLLPVVDVVHEAVERRDPLAQAGLDDRPVGGGDDARDRVERQDPLGGGRVVRVDREGHAAMQERAVRELCRAAHLLAVHRRDLRDDLGVVRARHDLASWTELERLVVEPARVVAVAQDAVRRRHRNHRCVHAASFPERLRATHAPRKQEKPQPGSD